MASFPPRERALEESVSSILPQCDELHIYLNDYDHIPQFLNHPKIIVFRSQDEIGDLGDVGKFYKSDNWTGYNFTVDDKIIYPYDYAIRMIQAIELYARQAVISLHGRITKPGCSSYYHDFVKGFRCLDEVSYDEFTHIIGTGVLAYHSDTITIPFKSFKTSNMSDIWCSIFLQAANIPALIRAHPAGWIKLSKLQSNGVSISACCSRNDKIQTDAINSTKWTLRSCPSYL